MPIIIETEDGRTFGPGQPYGYQGQYQGQRQPGIETANMRSVPQRTIMDEVRKYSNESTGSGWTPNRGDFARRFRDPDTTTVPVGPEGKKIFNDPDRFGRMRPTVNPYARRIDNNPMGGANIGGGWNQYEGGPGPRHSMPMPYYAATMGGGGGGNPFDPGNLGMDSGSYLSSRFGGGLDDAAGMNESARGMIEGAGFDVAGGPLMEDERVIRTLWKNAHANIAKTLGLSPGEASKAPRGLIQREFERLQNIYKNKRTYGGGIMKGLTKGNPLGLMMELAPAEPGMELLDEMFNPGVQTI